MVKSADRQAPIHSLGTSLRAANVDERREGYKGLELIVLDRVAPELFARTMDNHTKRMLEAAFQQSIRQVERFFHPDEVRLIKQQAEELRARRCTDARIDTTLHPIYLGKRFDCRRRDVCSISVLRSNQWL